MIKNKAGIYQFSSLLKYKEVIHGFSTRSFGSFKRESIGQVIPHFSFELNISQEDVVSMDQVHGNKVALVTTNDKQSFVASTDSVVTKEHACYLCVVTADCIPLLVYDPVLHICGVAHAGWKGALNNISAELIKKMVEFGSKSENIKIGIGPSIRVCCYSIDKVRAEQFTSAFPKLVATILEKRDDVTYLNLQKLVIEQLKKAGISGNHIEDSGICTHDKSDEFFSYRDKKSQAGVFAGIIGMR